MVCSRLTFSSRHSMDSWGGARAPSEMPCDEFTVLCIVGAVGSGLSILLGSWMCVLTARGWARAEYGSHEAAILQILCGMAFGDVLHACVWELGVTVRMVFPDEYGLSFINITDHVAPAAVLGVGEFGVVASSLWTSVFAWYVTSALQSVYTATALQVNRSPRGKQHAFWTHQALIHAGVWGAAAVISLSLAMLGGSGSRWESAPIDVLLSPFDATPEPPTTRRGLATLWTWRLGFFPVILGTQVFCMWR